MKKLVLLGCLVFAACHEGKVEVDDPQSTDMGSDQADVFRTPDLRTSQDLDSLTDVGSSDLGEQDADMKTDAESCSDETCIDVLNFAVTAINGGFESSVLISNDAPCQIEYREQGSATWIAHMPSEDSSMYGATIPHRQTITGLEPGTYEVRARDHIGSSYISEIKTVTLEEVVGCDPNATTWTPRADVNYGNWQEADWDNLFPGISNNYGAGNGDVKTELLDGQIAQIHRMVPRAPNTNNNGSSRVSGAWRLAPQQRYRLSQSIRLPDLFAAGVEVQSGKLGFGLTGGTAPSGGQPNPGGFSIRVIFKGDKIQPDTTSKAFAGVYLYSADQIGRYGDEIPLEIAGERVEFVRGKWAKVDFEIVMNTQAGAKDGQLRVWVDGILALEINDKEWFGIGTPIIDRMILSTFHGGADHRWAPSRINEIAFGSVCLTN